MLSLIIASSLSIDLFAASEEAEVFGSVEQKNLPSLVIYVSDNCPHGRRAEKEIVPFLAAQDWGINKDYTIIYDNGKDCPTFEYKGERFSHNGYTNLSTFNRDLRQVMGVSVVPDTLERLSYSSYGTSPMSGSGSFGKTALPALHNYQPVYQSVYQPSFSCPSGRCF